MIKNITWIINCMEEKEKSIFHRWLIRSLVLPLLDFLTIYLLLKVTNSIQNGMMNNNTIIQTICMGFIVLISGVITFSVSKAGAFVNNGLKKSFSTKMYRLFCNEDLQLHNKRSFSEVLTNVRFDCESCCDVFIALIQSLIMMLVWVVYAGVLILRVGWIGLAVTIILILAAFFAIWLSKRKIVLYGKQIRESRIRLNSLISTSYGAYKELRIDPRRENLQKRFENACDENMVLEVSYLSTGKFVSQSVKTLISSGIYFGIAAIMLTDIRMEHLFATLILMISILSRLIPLTSNFISVYNQYLNANTAFIQLQSNMEKFDNMEKQAKSVEKLRKKTLTFEEGIAVKNLSFHYPGGKTIFENASFFFPKGKKIAVIGASGVGKTTLLDLLLGLLQPDSGSISYDDYEIVRGEDGEGKCYANLGDIVSYIPQVVYLDGSTVRDNIVFMSDADTVNDEKIKYCLTCVDMLKEVEEMPHGLDSLLGQNGFDVSGGQRQRIALARAMYKDFDILIMDEATAALDIDTEKAVIDTISSLQNGKTLLMVTHHRSLVEQCDIVYQIYNHKLNRIK